MGREDLIPITTLLSSGIELGRKRLGGIHYTGRESQLSERIRRTHLDEEAGKLTTNFSQFLRGIVPRKSSVKRSSTAKRESTADVGSMACHESALKHEVPPLHSNSTTVRIARTIEGECR